MSLKKHGRVHVHKKLPTAQVSWVFFDHTYGHLIPIPHFVGNHDPPFLEWNPKNLHDMCTLFVMYGCHDALYARRAASSTL
jgi:hypothetical protein